MLKEYLSTLADKFREILGTTEKINAQEFKNEIVKVYNKGGQAGYSSGYDSGKMDGLIEGQKQGYDIGLSAGKREEYNNFWDAFQVNGTRTDYRYAFRAKEPIWTETNFKPKYDLKPKNAVYMFSSFKLNFPECLNGRVLDFSEATTMEYCFSNYTGTYLPTIDLTSCTKTDGALGWCYNLKTIEKIIVNENTPLPSNLFTSNSVLENVTFEGVIGQSGLNLSVSSLLTHDSLMSAINCLKDYSGTNNHSITLGATNLAKLTDAEKAIATEKGWTLA